MYQWYVVRINQQGAAKLLWNWLPPWYKPPKTSYQVESFYYIDGRNQLLIGSPILSISSLILQVRSLFGIVKAQGYHGIMIRLVTSLSQSDKNTSHVILSFSLEPLEVLSTQKAYHILIYIFYATTTTDSTLRILGYSWT